MKKTLSVLTILFIVFSSCAIAFAQLRQRRRSASINRGVTRTQGRQRSAIGAGGAGTYVRNGQRGRYVTRNGKRIWVPQGSPAKNPQSPTTPTRGVYEREQEAEIKISKPTSTPRP